MINGASQNDMHPQEAERWGYALVEHHFFKIPCQLKLFFGFVFTKCFFFNTIYFWSCTDVDLEMMNAASQNDMHHQKAKRWDHTLIEHHIF